MLFCDSISGIKFVNSRHFVMFDESEVQHDKENYKWIAVAIAIVSLVQCNFIMTFNNEANSLLITKIAFKMFSQHG